MILSPTDNQRKRKNEGGSVYLPYRDEAQYHMPSCFDPFLLWDSERGKESHKDSRVGIAERRYKAALATASS